VKNLPEWKGHKDATIEVEEEENEEGDIFHPLFSTYIALFEECYPLGCDVMKFIASFSEKLATLVLKVHLFRGSVLLPSSELNSVPKYKSLRSMQSPITGDFFF
jgi:hypothetical protein